MSCPGWSHAKWSSARAKIGWFINRLCIVEWSHLVVRDSQPRCSLFSKYSQPLPTPQTEAGGVLPGGQHGSQPHVSCAHEKPVRVFCDIYEAHPGCNPMDARSAQQHIVHMSLVVWISHCGSMFFLGIYVWIHISIKSTNSHPSIQHLGKMCELSFRLEIDRQYCS